MQQQQLQQQQQQQQQQTGWQLDGETLSTAIACAAATQQRHQQSRSSSTTPVAQSNNSSASAATAMTTSIDRELVNSFRTAASAIGTMLSQAQSSAKRAAETGYELAWLEMEQYILLRQQQLKQQPLHQNQQQQQQQQQQQRGALHAQDGSVMLPAGELLAFINARRQSSTDTANHVMTAEPSPDVHQPSSVPASTSSTSHIASERHMEGDQQWNQWNLQMQRQTPHHNQQQHQQQHQQQQSQHQSHQMQLISDVWSSLPIKRPRYDQ
ncbi:hypothetical protein GQ42DRAFT_179419 [Ramicandelaber brevisporus]|nr:hypothetical protein GQ42DRAFT_179419 [Ramicandelaber brevisporus]